MCAGDARAAAQDVTLDEIRAGYSQTIASLGSLWVRYRRIIDIDSSKEHLARGSQTENEWAFDGRRYLHRYHGQFSRGGERVLPQHSCSDGRTTWVFRYARDADGQVFLDSVWQRPILEIDGKRLWSDLASRTFVPDLGLQINYTGHSIGHETVPSLLQKDSAELTGMEEVDGVPCWHVDLGRHRGPSDPRVVSVDAWFDPAAGWLPRQTIVGDDQTPGEQRIVHRYVRVETAVGPCWFPEVCERIIGTTRYRLEVQDLKINEDLPDSVFRPEIPEGTRVVDITDPKVQMAEQARLDRARTIARGGPAHSSSARNSIPAAGRSPSRPVAAHLPVRPGSGRPETTSYVPIWLAVAGLAALGGAAWLMFQRRN